MHGAYLVIGERATGRLSASTRKCCTTQENARAAPRPCKVLAWRLPQSDDFAKSFNAWIEGENRRVIEVPSRTNLVRKKK
jgi:hypothetical protein